MYGKRPKSRQKAGGIGPVESSHGGGCKRIHIARWEADEALPDPEDVDALERVYQAPGLWHRWMRSHYDSYRKRYPEVVANNGLALAVVDVRHQTQDVMELQDKVERDAMDGKIDDPQAKEQYRKKLQAARASIDRTLEQLE